MKKQFTWISIYLVLADYVIPIPLTILMYFLWETKTDSSTYSFFILLLGLVYGYIVPGISSNIFKLWKFKWPFQFRNVFYNHGFIYTSYLALILYLVFPDNIQLSDFNIVRIVISNFALFAIVVSHHEIMAIKGGMMKSLNSVAEQGKSAVEVVTYFSFLCFGFLGASYAYCCIFAYQKIVVNNKFATEDLLQYFLICFAIMTFASMPYFIKERKQIIKNRKTGIYNKS
jgi:hypothetical protein